MKKLLLVLVLSVSFLSTAQELTLRIGTIMKSIAVNDTIPEDFALFLPTKFDASKSWPIIFVYDMQGRGDMVLRMFSGAAEQNNYILAASNKVNDSLSLTQNVLISRRMFNTVFKMFKIQKDRVYTAGFDGGARIASVMPTFMNQITGVISCGSTVGNKEILSSKNPFHFVGVVGNEDFNYPEMVKMEKLFDLMKFPNQTLIFNGGHKWPSQHLLSRAMELFDLRAMTKKVIPVDTAFIENSYDNRLLEVNELIANSRAVQAYDELGEIMEVYRHFKDVDSLKSSRKTLKRGTAYKSQKRSLNTWLFKESLIKDDYDYYLEEDIFTYNYNNLGWWNYQMGELKKHRNSKNEFQRQMGVRLEGYLNALIEDNIDLITLDTPIDEEALNFLWMLKTITSPDDFSYYKKVISLNAKVEDYGTALYYLEELLKRGYSNTDELYALEHTALFRITPEFNALVAKYLKKARYDIIEE
ncbi:MAG: alpha/beta hydrolase [Maribacter sp.]|nr:alpha/beta hydrolase [Maribacter sp.]